MKETLLKYCKDCFKEQEARNTPGNHTNSFISIASYNFITHNNNFFIAIIKFQQYYRMIFNYIKTIRIRLPAVLS